MKNVVITGSTRGIGYAMAVEFLKLDAMSLYRVVEKNLTALHEIPWILFRIDLSTYHVMCNLKKAYKSCGMIL